MDTKDHWDEAYSGRPANRLSWHQDRPSLSLQFIAAAVGPGASVIDVGGGTSSLVAHLLHAGFADLSVLDVSGAAIAAARSRLGDRADFVRWYQTDIRDFEPEREWDLWHDRAVFHFLVDPPDRSVYRAVLDRALRPGGHLVIATFAPDGPEKCSGLPVERYDAAKLAAELGPSLELLESATEIHVKPDGGEQSFQFARFVRKG